MLRSVATVTGHQALPDASDAHVDVGEDDLTGGGEQRRKTVSVSVWITCLCVGELLQMSLKELDKVLDQDSFLCFRVKCRLTVFDFSVIFWIRLRIKVSHAVGRVKVKATFE